MHGVSTRSVDDLVRAMGATGVSKSQVSRMCAEIDARGRILAHGTSTLMVLAGPDAPPPA